MPKHIYIHSRPQVTVAKNEEDYRQSMMYLKLSQRSGRVWKPLYFSRVSSCCCGRALRKAKSESKVAGSGNLKFPFIGKPGNNLEAAKTAEPEKKAATTGETKVALSATAKKEDAKKVEEVPDEYAGDEFDEEIAENVAQS